MRSTNNQQANTALTRRTALKSGLALAGGALLGQDAKAGTAIVSSSQLASNVSNAKPGRRKLGTLEVSSIGLGVQNMSRTYQTTIPSRPEMYKIIQTAFDRGVTLFDAAEAYGPFKVERILGEALEGIHNKVVIETKFGWKKI